MSIKAPAALTLASKVEHKIAKSATLTHRPSGFPTKLLPQSDQHGPKQQSWLVLLIAARTPWTPTVKSNDCVGIVHISMQADILAELNDLTGV